MNLPDNLALATAKYSKGLDKEFREQAEEDFSSGYLEGYQAAMIEAKEILEKDRKAFEDITKK